MTEPHCNTSKKESWNFLLFEILCFYIHFLSFFLFNSYSPFVLYIVRNEKLYLNLHGFLFNYRIKIMAFVTMDLLLVLKLLR